MLAIDRILLPTDYGEGTEAAVAHAAFLARRHGARLDVLHVTGPAGVGTRPFDIASRAGDVTLQIVERTDDSALRAIMDFARESDADLVVMATRGRRGLDHFLMGSVAEQVVRGAECPVLTIGPRAAGPEAPGPRRLLVAIDFSAHSEVALRHAAGLAGDYDATVDLLHAVHVPVLPPGYGIAPIGVDRTPAFVEGSRTALGSLAARHLPADRAGDVIVEVGHPADVILRTIEERSPFMVLLSTHGLTGLKRLALGSVAEYVVRRASCTVFTVRSFGKSLLPDPMPHDASTA
jgi:nucleotide-binding universal stress UspA family protein